MTASLSTRTPQQAIAALLARYTPQKLLLLGASELPAVSAFHSAHRQCQVTTAPAAPLAPELAAQRFDLALLVDCLELARDVRELDMRASPYDLLDWGYEPVRIETPEGKAAYVAAQRGFSERGQALRARLVQVTSRALQVR